MEKIIGYIFGSVAVLVLVALVFLYSAFSWGFATFKFWYWFILPIFPSLPHITFYQAVGMFLFLELFKGHSSNSNENSDKKKETPQWVWFAKPWIFLLVGYFIYLVIS